MKAKIQPRIELENRTRLEEVIPIPTPFLVFLDPSDICNFQCKFCPTGNRPLIKELNRDSGLMDFSLYQKIIDDLAEFDTPIKVLRLYKDGEPLLHPRFADMVRYAKECGCALQVDTTTNGSLLNPEKNLELINAGLDRIHISLNGLSDASYKEFTGFKMDFKKLVDNVRHLYEHKKDCLICIKMVDDGLSQKEQDYFFNTFGDITDRIFIEHVAPCWPKFEMSDVTPNSEVGIYGQEIKEVEVCPYIFYSLSINSNGKVSLCFLDWSREMIVGDLKTRSFKEIWNGDELLTYRKMHLQKKRKSHAICSACGQLTHCLPDNIDAYSEVLLNHLEASGNAKKTHKGHKHG
jgi:radical SAM protein with 4Fe4S-binding SPASM domain